MKPLEIKSAAEQVADHLQLEILSGNLTGTMPGSRAVATTLGINHKTTETAFGILRDRGLIQSQGAGRPQRITPPRRVKRREMTIRILLYEESDATSYDIIEIRHQLANANHRTAFAPKTLIELRKDPKRVARMVRSNPADAWIVIAASNEVLRVFAEESIPTFALFGYPGELPVASTCPKKSDGIMIAVDRLVALGHRRIVLLMREVAATAILRGPQKRFLDRLKHHGITPGRYNLPVWEDSPQGLLHCLNSLFQHTPPTAMFIDDTLIYFAVQNFLSQRDMVAPRDISLVCLDPDPSFGWCQPSVAHLSFNPDDWVRRVIQWASKLAKGIVDMEKKTIEATLVDGGSIGPVPRNRSVG